MIMRKMKWVNKAITGMLFCALAVSVLAAPASADAKKAEKTKKTAEFDANGTYTVSLDGADFSKETTISQLHVATDIPTSSDVKFSDVSLQINGREIVSFDEGYMEDEEPYLVGGKDLLLLNHWRPELIKELEGQGSGETAENGWKLLQGAGDENVSVTFTVSGFAYDNENAKAPAEDTASSDAGSDQSGKTTSESKDGGMTVPIVIGGVVVVVIIAAVVISRKRSK